MHVFKINYHTQFINVNLISIHNIIDYDIIKNEQSIYVECIMHP